MIARCRKPGCGANEIIGKPCTDRDCPQQFVPAEAYASLSQEVERLTAEVAKTRNEMVSHFHAGNDNAKRAEAAEAERDSLALWRREASDTIVNLTCRSEAAEAEVSRLTAERDAALVRVERMRRYCSAAARDMAGFAQVVQESEDVFPKTLRDLLDTSEFMDLAAEGREDGTLYEDELSKALERVKVLEGAFRCREGEK